MAKPKRSAEELARLIVKAGPPPLVLFGGRNLPLPPSEWATVSAEVRSISRRELVRFSVHTCLFTLTMCGLLFWLVLPHPRIPLSIASYCIIGTWVICSCASTLGIALMKRAYDTRMFVWGFVMGLGSREPGAPKKWTAEVCKETVAAVQAVAAEKGLGIARSIDILKKRDSERWESLSEQRYYEALRKLKKPTA